MEVAAILLTGGESRRMGTDKARVPGPSGRRLAEQTADVLATVAGLLIEVGSAASGLPHVPDDHPGEGPLAALATGVEALRRLGWEGPALVMATDMPLLGAGLVHWLAGHPYPGSVVPLVDGRPQWLSARYAADTLAAAPALVAAGHRRVADLFADRPFHAADPGEWAGVADGGSFRDADTPEQLAALLKETP